ncbi:MAG TPA: M23 family metallopeptidase [Candidatus Krumholzibacteriaceae bacterium]|nr:M23 family metallopeptidase [Candidatus Krumholzibacteriaceae bacterium]
MPDKYPTKRTLLITAVMLLYFGCSETPIYHGKLGRRRSRKKIPTTNKQTPDIAIKFSPPVHNFSKKRITSSFGIRNSPNYKYKERHTGIDIDTTMGEPVVASASGKVVFAGRRNGYGKIIIVDHGKRVHTVYAHLSSILCKMGDYVKTGDIIGKAGKSGRATGTHLHFEIRKKGYAVNPILYIDRTL